MRCPNCDKIISQKDRFCRFCGKPVVAPPPPPPPQPGRWVLPIENSDFGPGQILASQDTQSGTAWGAHIYTGGSQAPYQIKTRPEGCPEWVDNRDWPRWFRRGLVVWDHSTQSIGAILAREALELLEKRNSNDERKSQGVAIVERSESIKYDAPRRRRSPKKTAEPEPPPEKPERVIKEDERLRLAGEAAAEFYDYLRSNEAQLRQMVAEEDERLEEIQKGLLTVLIRWHHESELSKLDTARRKFTWVCQDHPTAFVCDIPPDRATIALSDDGMWWRPIIERPKGMPYHGEIFLELTKAMDWAEQKIPELRAEEEEWARKWAQEKAEEQAKIAALPKKDLAPYWIDPSALEPARLTYRVIIELECEPRGSKQAPITFGKYRRLDEKYYTPAMLAHEMNLVPSQVEIKQLLPDEGWYFIRSAAVFYELHVAAAQAQHVWDQSAVMERYEENKVIRARYGFEEAGTEYRTWLGGCAQPDNPWPASGTRAEHMAQRAMRATLLNALDVNGYRAFLQMPFKYRSDEQLLEAMHKSRARTEDVPAEARAESEKWLQNHNVGAVSEP